MELTPPPDTGQVLPSTPSFPPVYKKIPPWKSKTLLTNAIIALLMLYPKTHDFVSQYSSSVVLAIAGINFLLRLVTHGKISLDS